MFKNNKGFTLVELLAVIVVLAIIMVIATQSVGKSITKARTQAFEKNMDLAVKNAKRILATDGTLTDKALKDSLSYSTSEYDFQVIPSVDGDGYLMMLISNPSGKFKNVDFSTMSEKEKNTNWIYTMNAGNKVGRNTIGFKIKSDGDLVIPTSDEEKIIKDTIKNNCTEIGKEETYDKETYDEDDPQKNVGKVISFCNSKKIYKSNKELVKGKREDFYVISEDNNTVTALAKYTLNTLEGDFFNTQSASDGYTLKFADFKGFNGYWKGLLEDPSKSYGFNYPVYVYDENSLLWKYMERYKKYLTEISNINLSNIRLINMIELKSLGCVGADNACNTAIGHNWVYSVSYWSGTAKDRSYVYYVHKVGRMIDYGYYYSPNIAGIRPVITINKSELE